MFCLFVCLDVVVVVVCARARALTLREWVGVWEAGGGVVDSSKEKTDKQQQQKHEKSIPD